MSTATAVPAMPSVALTSLASGSDHTAASAWYVQDSVGRAARPVHLSAR